VCPHKVTFCPIHCRVSPVECIVLNVANSLQSGPFWAVSSASVSDCEVVGFYHSVQSWFMSYVIGWRPGGLFQPFGGNANGILWNSLASILSSIYAMCYMPEDGETPGLDSCEEWLTGPPRDFCIGNKLVPLDTEQPLQAPLIKSLDFPCSLLCDCLTFWAIQEDR